MAGSHTDSVEGYDCKKKKSCGEEVLAATYQSAGLLRIFFLKQGDEGPRFLLRCE